MIACELVLGDLAGRRQVFVWLGSAFSGARFDSVGPVSGAASAQMFQQNFVQLMLLLDRERERSEPGPGDGLHRSGKAHLVRRPSGAKGGGSLLGADQVVSQQRRPDFVLNHMWTFAAKHIRPHRRLDRADIQLHQPALAVQRGHIVFGDSPRIGERGHHCQLSTPDQVLAKQ